MKRLIGCNKSLVRYIASSLAFFLAPALTIAVQAHEGGGQDAISVYTANDLSRATRSQHLRDKSFMRRQWGVEVLYVRQTAAGYMLEFRYKVHDAKKAKALFDHQKKPVLAHVESGAQLIVPAPAKVGALRNSKPPVAGQTYWMFFANPGKLVKPGEHVNINIGDYLVENIVVL